MDDALPVRRFQRVSHLLCDRKRLGDRNRSSRDPLCEVLALDEFHDQRADPRSQPCGGGLTNN